MILYMYALIDILTAKQNGVHFETTFSKNIFEWIYMIYCMVFHWNVFWVFK